MPGVKVIAEIGENHIGNMEIARQLIRDAKEAGADYAKFQSYNAETFRSDDPEYDWFKKVSLSNEDHFMLKELAESNGIRFLSAPCSLERARFLCEGLGLREIKIASGLMLAFPILDYVNEHADTVFISSGMATITEIQEALSHLDKVENLYLLHCITQYPCEDQDANILAMQDLKKHFPQCHIGYSDHTRGHLAPLLAVALGTTVIEKHFTFDKKAEEGTDHVLSVNPPELKEMISNIRRAELMLGDGIKVPTDSEKEIISFVRNRFVVNENV